MTEPTRPSSPAPDPLRTNPTGQPAPGRAERTRGASPAFQVLLERLSARAQELEEKSKTLDAPGDLPQAVDSARASLEDALSIGEKLLEAYRAARARGERPEPRP